jgi:hypothetical protein
MCARKRLISNICARISNCCAFIYPAAPSPPPGGRRNFIAAGRPRLEKREAIRQNTKPSGWQTGQHRLIWVLAPGLLPELRGFPETPENGR